MTQQNAAGVSIHYSVPYESSVGVLFQAFHTGQALAPLQEELEERARATRLFDGTGVDFLRLYACVNARIGKRTVCPTSVVVDEKWQYVGADVYLAYVYADLTSWTPKTRARTPEEALAGAVPLLQRLGWLGVAQVAVELGVDSSRIAAFLETSPARVEELNLRTKRARRRDKPTKPLSVQILFRADDVNVQMAERSRLSEILQGTAAHYKLGTYDGGSSSDEHFEFGYLVFDFAKAEAHFRDALARAGVADGAILFYSDA